MENSDDDDEDDFDTEAFIKAEVKKMEKETAPTTPRMLDLDPMRDTPLPSQRIGSIPDFIAEGHGILLATPLIVTTKVPVGMAINIPGDGPEFDEILRATGCKNRAELLTRIQLISEAEDMIAVRFQEKPGDEACAINISQDPNVKYEKTLDDENWKFLCKLKPVVY